MLPSSGGLLHFWLTGGETKPINLWGVVIKTIDIAGSLEPLRPSLNACLVSWGEMKGRHCKRCRRPRPPPVERRSLHSDVNGFPDAPFTPSVLSVWRLHPQYYIPSRLKRRSLKTLLDPVLRLKLRGSVLLRTGENGGRQKRSRLASWLDQTLLSILYRVNNTCTKTLLWTDLRRSVDVAWNECPPSFWCLLILQSLTRSRCPSFLTFPG